MTIVIPISKARKELHNILKKLQENPENVYQISVNSVILGELKAPSRVREKGNVAQKLLKLARELKKELGEEPISELTTIGRDHDEYIYVR